MRVLFATGRLYAPDRIGGAEESVDSLLKLAQAEGHLCEAVAQIRPGPKSQYLRLARRLTGRRGWKGWPDRRNGYVTYRGLSWTLPELVFDRIQSFEPAVVLTQLQRSDEIIDVARACGVPVILRVCDADFLHNGDQLKKSGCLVMSNSDFIAGWVRERFGVGSQVVYPFVDLDRYRVSRPDPDLITLVNPSPVKGGDLALDVAARLPRRRFLFQEAWPLSSVEEQELRRRVGFVPNVTLGRPTRDMIGVYRSTALLLVPSRWEEAFPRVVLEAQVSGIPVVGRGVGGIPEAVGAGGIVMSASAGAAEWADAIESVLSDRARYDALSEGARANAARPEFDARSLARRFIALATAHRAAAAGRFPATPDDPGLAGGSQR
jgi:glycosyltransferase involved in cell wall biosynthesis